ncbi:MAG: N-acetyl-gamma-glutamyl-phosphate reductase, partial [Clostridiales bacterium]|nr:N-acetyl-gamma-glutamyl-phosphate reductase [Clostridiales bacterium]
MKQKVFVDGSEGTTGLRIFERFQGRDDVELIKIDPELRKDPEERKRLINASDITFLCLPDVAARESAGLVDPDNDHTVIIDTSTAHRTEEGWAYGFPELSDKHLEAVKTGNRIAVPGCYASGFISLIYPLVAGGIIPKD